jgi:hypothetical protein
MSGWTLNTIVADGACVEGDGAKWLLLTEREPSLVREFQTGQKRAGKRCAEAQWPVWHRGRDTRQTLLKRQVLRPPSKQGGDALERVLDAPEVGRRGAVRLRGSMARWRRGAAVRPRQSFKGRQFTAEVILWAVRWYRMFPISYRDLELVLADCGVEIAHTTLLRWV